MMSAAHLLDHYERCATLKAKWHCLMAWALTDAHECGPFAARGMDAWRDKWLADVAKEVEDGDTSVRVEQHADWNNEDPFFACGTLRLDSYVSGSWEVREGVVMTGRIGELFESKDDAAGREHLALLSYGRPDMKLCTGCGEALKIAVHHLACWLENEEESRGIPSYLIEQPLVCMIDDRDGCRSRMETYVDVRQAKETLLAILVQRGAKDLGFEDDRLTHAMDVVIFG